MFEVKLYDHLSDYDSTRVDGTVGVSKQGISVVDFEPEELYTPEDPHTVTDTPRRLNSDKIS